MTNDGRHIHCTLDYFRDTGKWYSTGEYAIFYEDGLPVPFWTCASRVQKMLNEGKRPGLVEGYDFNVMLTVYSEFGPMQVLFVRGVNINSHKEVMR